MKITIKYTALLLLLLPFASACNNGSPIADQSELTEQTKQQEVQKTELVKSVVELNSKVYASDGNIYVKNESAVRGWREISGPGGIIIKLAADQTSLYALNKEKELYFLGKDSGTWQTVPTSTVGTVETIFCDGLQTAYLKANSNFYKLSAATNPTQEGSITSDVMVKTKGGTNTYTASGGTVTGTSSAPGSSSLGSVSGLGTVYSLTHSQVDNALYAGTSKGLKKLPMNEEGKLTGTAENPPGNWSATIKTYESFAVLATGTNTGDAALYASTSLGGSNDSKINGLWGYYYNRRNTWQQE